jgi:[ribosomal protein S18]-alanine N-acetyltransferase
MHARAGAALQIRQASEADARFAVRLAEQAFGEFDPHAARTTDSLLREAGAETLIAVVAGEPAGFIVLGRTGGDVTHVNAIAVAPNQRGKGVGQRLMQEAERCAQRRSAKRLSLHTAQANLAALSLFLRCGFNITQRSASGYPRPQPTCRLEKRLR